VNGVCSIVLEAAVREQPFPAAGPNVKLRSPSYVLRGVNGQPKEVTALVGPVIRIGKGDRLRVLLNNSLDPKLLPTENPRPPHNFPQGFALTNLHTHGLHVSPVGKGDNVYAMVRPGASRRYEYDVLPEHPAGTFWYHPHSHGSVALQMTGGMAGALIVEGDLDNVPEIKKATEHVLVLQQIHGSLDPGDKTRTRLIAQPRDLYDKIRNSDSGTSASSVAPPFRPGPQRSQGGLLNPAAVATTLQPPSLCQPPLTLAASQDNEWLLINGQWMPTIRMKPGEVQRASTRSSTLPLSRTRRARPSPT
jgi:FtsP/CotA-like multicopper oxidase with cupredoxin domain